MAVQPIPFANLALSLIPVLVILIIIWRWRIGHKNALYAVGRMLTQLMLVGYVLTFIFEADNALIVILTLSVMLTSASIISLRTVRVRSWTVYLKSLGAIFVGGVWSLLIVTQVVIGIEPWFQPSYMIPLAGMIFANSMNAISLAGERLMAETDKGQSYIQARGIALQASLIPVINSLFAVGLVSFPGLMTGQILSGVSPFIAAKYQIVIMCMIFGSAGISSAVFLALLKSDWPVTENNPAHPELN
jgi:putative ABC transport system permease protein